MILSGNFDGYHFLPYSCINCINEVIPLLWDVVISVLMVNCLKSLDARLFIYPPPPATGGITVTNEDFYCLNDGEFLNDVIIDFYLK